MRGDARTVEGVTMSDECLPKVEYAKSMMLSALKNLYKLNPEAMEWMEKRIDQLIASVRYDAQLDREEIQCSIEEKIKDTFKHIALRREDR